MAPPNSIPTEWELMLFHQVQALSEKLNEVIIKVNSQFNPERDVKRIEKIDIHAVK